MNKISILLVTLLSYSLCNATQILTFHVFNDTPDTLDVTIQVNENNKTETIKKEETKNIEIESSSPLMKNNRLSVLSATKKNSTPQKTAIFNFGQEVVDRSMKYYIGKTNSTITISTINNNKNAACQRGKQSKRSKKAQFLQVSWIDYADTTHTHNWVYCNERWDK